MRPHDAHMNVNVVPPGQRWVSGARRSGAQTSTWHPRCHYNGRRRQHRWVGLASADNRMNIATFTRAGPRIEKREPQSAVSNRRSIASRPAPERSFLH